MKYPESDPELQLEPYRYADESEATEVMELLNAIQSFLHKKIELQNYYQVAKTQKWPDKKPFIIVPVAPDHLPK